MAAAVLGGGVYVRKEGGERHEGGFLLVSHNGGCSAFHCEHMHAAYGPCGHCT